MSFELSLNAYTSDIWDNQSWEASSSQKPNVGITQKFVRAAALGGVLSLIPAGITDESHTAQIDNHIQADKSVITSLVLPADALNLTSQLVKNALYHAQHEVFESGMESAFGLFINRFVLLYGQQGLNVLSSSLKDSVLSIDVIVEAIRSLGAIRDSSTLNERFIVLLRYLDHESPVVRDAAALAFADLGEKGAISYLRAAAEHEKFSVIRSSFLSVAKELEEI